MKRFILGLFIIPFVVACGGSVSDGNSGSSFESVRVYVSGSSIEGGAYDADSVDKGSGSCDNVSNYTFTPDDIKKIQRRFIIYFFNSINNSYRYIYCRIRFNNIAYRVIFFCR